MDTKNQINNSLRALRQSPKICKENKELVSMYHAENIARGLSTKRCVKVLQELRFLAEQSNKPFKKMKKQDIVKLLSWLESTNYSERTKRDYKIILRSFFKWLRGTNHYPEEVAWIKTPLKNSHKLPEELLTEEDIKALVSAAKNPRDKAFVLTLYEFGCRIGELLSLEVRNVSFDDHGAVLRVTGKTGDRRVRVISSAPAIALWLDHHPTGKGALFCSNDGTALNYNTIRCRLLSLAKKASLKKKVNPSAKNNSDWVIRLDSVCHPVALQETPKGFLDICGSRNPLAKTLKNNWCFILRGGTECQNFTQLVTRERILVTLLKNW